MTKITLKPGDYVSTEGMTEDQYHAVAKAFMEAGARDGGYQSQIKLENFGWCHDPDHMGLLFQSDSGASREFSRHLTIAQVLGTEGETDTIEALLAKADKHARKAARHEAKRQECIDKARALMPEGWGIDDDRKRIRLGDEPKEDMSDPANWKEGDVFEVTNGKACGAEFHDGEKVAMRDENPTHFRSLDRIGVEWSLPHRAVRFLHRPA